MQCLEDLKTDTKASVQFGLAQSTTAERALVEALVEQHKPVSNQQNICHSVALKHETESSRHYDNHKCYG